MWFCLAMAGLCVALEFNIAAGLFLVGAAAFTPAPKEAP